MVLVAFTGGRLHRCVKLLVEGAANGPASGVYYLLADQLRGCEHVHVGSGATSLSLTVLKGGSTPPLLYHHGADFTALFVSLKSGSLA